jgi:hypothetical protein
MYMRQDIFYKLTYKNFIFITYIFSSYNESIPIQNTI